MATVYLVTDGDYSDYHVLGVYSAKDKAEHAAKLYAVGDNRIEEYELDEMPDAPPGMFRWQVDMDRGGNTIYTRHITVIVGYNDSDWRPGPGTGRRENRKDSEYISFFVWARDESHAVKVANERRTRLIADGEWTTNWGAWIDRGRKVAPA